MARVDIAAILAETGLPVVYYEWPDGATPTFPCLRYVYEGDSSFDADNKHYRKFDSWSVTLVSEWKDDAAEATLESVLESHGIVYQKLGDVRVESEKLTQVEYVFSYEH